MRNDPSIKAENRELKAEDRLMNEAEMEAHLLAYMAAFLATEQESIGEFEDVGVACWSKADRADKR
jgi:hypothetical protein